MDTLVFPEPRLGLVIANARGPNERSTLEDYAGFGWQEPFLGAVFSFPLTDGISLSAGSVAYGGLMMTAIVLVIVLAVLLPIIEINQLVK